MFINNFSQNNVHNYDSKALVMTFDRSSHNNGREIVSISTAQPFIKVCSHRAPWTISIACSIKP